VQRALTDNAPDWLILVDPQLRVQYSNRSLRGVSVEGVVGRNGLDLLDPAVRGLLSAACERALAQQTPQFAETYEQMPWGEWCHLEYSAAPVIEDGRAIGLSVRITNATGRRHAEETLRTQARVLETMREGVVLFRPAGDIRLANPAAGRLFGLPVEALVGAPVSRLALPAEMVERILRLRPSEEPGAAAASREWLADRGDGSQFLVEGVFSAVEFEGEPMFIGVLQDVTDRRQLERAIIETSTFEQQRIASDLHDGLGQELTGIALLLRAAAGRLPGDAQAGASLVQEATSLLESAVQSARALAHGLAPAALDLGGLPGALSDLASRIRRTYGIRAQFRKQIGAPLQLDTNQANHLYRIAQEGVNNAVRHGRATFITLRLSADAQGVKLEVIDNGSGIPVPARRSSAGMGLRIMEYRARMLGGELLIEAPRRGGTAICCCVPVPAGT
jgi:PAS domain S-box-containing protein